MSDRVLAFAGRLVQARDIEVRIGEVRILGERLLIDLDRLVRAPGILQQHGEIE